MRAYTSTTLFSISYDSLYKECIALATNSHSVEMRFGAIILKDDKIIGEGWNKLVNQKKTGKLPIVMGYANHAEVSAMNDALLNGFDLKDAEIYVAGYFPQDKTLYIPDNAYFTCTHCPVYFEKYGIKEVSVPLRNGWTGMSIEDAKESSRTFYGKSQEKRETVGKTRFTLDDIL